MNFSEELRQLADTIWAAQLRHPFVVALGKGTLPPKKFKYYILQDARYLEELARIFAIGSAKATDADTALRFAQLVEETMVVERGLHEMYGKAWLKPGHWVKSQWWLYHVHGSIVKSDNIS